MQFQKQLRAQTSSAPMPADETPLADPLAGGDAPPSTWAEQNMRRRTVALAFFKPAALADMMVVRLCMKPIVSLLQAHLTRGGQAWQRRQVHRMQGLAVGALPQLRHTRLGEQVLLVCEGAFMEELRELTHSTLVLFAHCILVTENTVSGFPNALQDGQLGAPALDPANHPVSIETLEGDGLT